MGEYFLNALYTLYRSQGSATKVNKLQCMILLMLLHLHYITLSWCFYQKQLTVD